MGNQVSYRDPESPIKVPEGRSQQTPRVNKDRKPIPTMNEPVFTSAFNRILVELNGDGSAKSDDQIYDALLKLITGISMETKRAIFPTNKRWIGFLEKRGASFRISRESTPAQVLMALNARRVISSLVVTTRLIVKDIAAANGGDSEAIHVLSVEPFEPPSKATLLARVSTHNDSCGSDGTGTLVRECPRSALKRPGSQGGKRVRFNLPGSPTERSKLQGKSRPMSQCSFTDYASYREVSPYAGLTGPFRPVTDERLSFGSM